MGKEGRGEACSDYGFAKKKLGQPEKKKQVCSASGQPNRTIFIQMDGGQRQKTTLDHKYLYLEL